MWRVPPDTVISNNLFSIRRRPGHRRLYVKLDTKTFYNWVCHSGIALDILIKQNISRVKAISG